MLRHDALLRRVPQPTRVRESTPCLPSATIPLRPSASSSTPLPSAARRCACHKTPVRSPAQAGGGAEGGRLASALSVRPARQAARRCHPPAPIPQAHALMRARRARASLFCPLPQTQTAKPRPSNPSSCSCCAGECPLGCVHADNGEEFGLGCGLCKEQTNF